MNRNELYHYGILGMKWGIRRYQNPDGSLTDAGRKRYLTDDGKLNERGKKQILRQVGKIRSSDPWAKVRINNKKADKLTNNPILIELAKDLQLKSEEYTKAYDKFDKMVAGVRESPRKKRCAEEVAAIMADEIDDYTGEPNWKPYGSRKAYIDIRTKMYNGDVGTRFLAYDYAYHKRFDNNNYPEFSKINTQWDICRSKESEMTYAIGDFQKSILDQFKGEPLPKGVSEEDFDTIIGKATFKIPTYKPRH